MVRHSYYRDSETDESIAGLAARGLDVDEIAALTMRSPVVVRDVLDERGFSAGWVPLPREIEQRSKAIRDKWTEKVRHERGRYTDGEF